MWIMLNDAFLSLVQKDCRRDELLVRARRKGDIEKIFEHASVTYTPNADYHWRAVVKRSEVADALIGEVNRITYPNFKDSVTDGLLHSAYLRVWTAMNQLQQRERGAPMAWWHEDQVWGSGNGGDDDWASRADFRTEMKTEKDRYQPKKNRGRKKGYNRSLKRGQ